jgi:hypothetical protein
LSSLLTANNTGSQSQHAVSLGMLNNLGQYTSIMLPFIFPTKEEPKWHKGFGLNLTFMLLTIILSSAMSAYYHMESRCHDQIEGGPPAKGVVIGVINQHDLARNEFFSVSNVDPESCLMCCP